MTHPLFTSMALSRLEYPLPVLTHSQYVQFGKRSSILVDRSFHTRSKLTEKISSGGTHPYLLYEIENWKGRYPFIKNIILIGLTVMISACQGSLYKRGRPGFDSLMGRMPFLFLYFFSFIPLEVNESCHGGRTCHAERMRQVLAHPHSF